MILEIWNSGSPMSVHRQALNITGVTLSDNTAGYTTLDLSTLASLTPSGALTLTGGAASTWSTSAGALTVSGFAGINLQKAGATLLDIGVTGASAITIAAAKSLNFAAGAGGLDASGLTGALKFGASSATIGFFGAAAAARPTAYTQTYATASRTHANPTGIAVTNNSGGSTADTTIAAITTGGGTYPDATPTKDAIAKLAVLANQLVADMANVKQVLNSTIDDLQTLGLLQ